MLFQIFILAITSLATAEFFTPQQKGRGVWRVGDREPVKYKTSFTVYSIALWQQSLTEGSATLGPIVYQTTNGPGSRFDWLVQTFDFDLELSNVFFFWCFEGPPSAQGNGSLPNMVSSFFNITNERLASSTTTSAPSSTSNSAPSSTSTSAGQPTGGNDHESPGGSVGLSTGAQIGIGVSSGIAGLLLIVGIVFWHRYRKTKKSLEKSHRPGPEGYRSSLGQKPPFISQYPIEVGPDRREEPAELG